MPLYHKNPISIILVFTCQLHYCGEVFPAFGRYIPVVDIPGASSPK
jgi:hypothetical protein